MIDNLTTIVTLILALSLASERLVEILKGVHDGLAAKISDAKTGWFSRKRTKPAQEAWRRAGHHILAVICGVFTAWLAKETVPEEAFPDTPFGIVALGLLASGGSGLWNSVLGFLGSIKKPNNPEQGEVNAGQAG